MAGSVHGATKTLVLFEYCYSIHFWQDGVLSEDNVGRLFGYPTNLLLLIYTPGKREAQKLNCIAQGTHYSEPSQCSILELSAKSAMADLR